ncbi:MAG: hypothetical protein J6X33_01750 [Clostridiales bacterium]|nr:hypothetical protein [Clostridiales bacterium]
MKDFRRVIATLLTVSVMASAGCTIVRDPEATAATSDTSAQVTEETTTTTSEEETTTTSATEETETTADTSGTTEETTEDTTATESSSEETVPGDGIPDKAGDATNNCYKIFMSYIDEIEKESPGSTYGFTAEYDQEADGVIWVLLVSYASDRGRSAYVVDGSSVIDYKTHTVIPDRMLDHKTVKTLPALFEITDGSFSLETSIKDGYYYGSDIAYTEDGKYLLFDYGKGSFIKIEDAKKLKPGDKVTFEGSGETFMVDEGTSGLDATFEEQEYWFDDIYLPEEMKGEYLMLSEASDNPEYKSLGTALLPISEDVEIRDDFASLFDKDQIDKFKDTYGTTGNVFLDSYYYIGNTFVSTEYTVRSNGYVSGQALLYPVVVKDGKIVKIGFSWR